LATLGRNKAKAEGAAEEENSTTFAEIGDASLMFEEKVLFLLYPCEAGTHETQYVFQRYRNRGFDAYRAIGLHGKAQGAAMVALEREV
jgi:hypothetical protein